MVHLAGADLTGANLEGARFFLADMDGALLAYPDVDDLTRLDCATMRGAAIWAMDLRLPALNNAFHQAFGDGSVTLPKRYQAGTAPLAHWAKAPLPHAEFILQWRAWQDEIGYTPPD